MSASDSTPVPVIPPWSAYAGEAFNLTERRPLSILSETDRAFVAAGFYHQGQFWNAVIPKTGVAAIIGQKMNFSKPKRRHGGTRPSLFFLNHVQARVQMEPDRPIALHPIGEAPAGEPARHILDFSYSVEAVGPFGRRWNLSDALLGNLAIVHRFLSSEEVAFERIMRDRMQIVQSPPLPLEPEVRDTMLHEAIRESHNVGLSKPYFMVRPPFSATNCTSEPLKLLDGVLRTPPWQRVFYRLPVYPRGYLKLRGLWQQGRSVPTLNEEMADWLASDAAKKRRHMHVHRQKEIRAGRDAPRVSWSRNLARLLKAMRGDRR